MIFDPSSTERNVEVETVDDTPEKRREYNISINGTMVVGAPLANFSTVVGGPVTILVYDNDCEYFLTLPAHSFSLSLSPSPLALYLSHSHSLSPSLVEIGFTKDEFSAVVGASNIDDICVEIIKPAERSDIEPSLSIPITVTLKNSASSGKLVIAS